MDTVSTVVCKNFETVSSIIYSVAMELTSSSVSANLGSANVLTAQPLDQRFGKHYATVSLHAESYSLLNCHGERLPWSDANERIFDD